MNRRVCECEQPAAITFITFSVAVYWEGRDLTPGAVFSAITYGHRHVTRP
jgi:hypothetical protein